MKKSNSTLEKKKYKVVAGVHRMGDVEYKKGDVVESDKDLIKLFPNKFVRLHPDEVTEVEPEAAAAPIPAPDKVKGKEVSNKKQPKAAAAPADEGTDNLDVDDLDDEDTSNEKKKKLTKKELATLAQLYGKNVTGSYRDAAEQCGVVIFKNASKQYTVIDAADQKPLKDKTMSKDAMLELLEQLKG